jgi:hypothetical protein
MPRAARGNERIDDELKDPLYRKKVQCSAEPEKEAHDRSTLYIDKVNKKYRLYINLNMRNEI